MTPVYDLLSHCSGSQILGHHTGNALISMQYPSSAGASATNSVALAFVPKWTTKSKSQSLCMRCIQPNYVMSRGRSDGRFEFDDAYHADPFWLEFFKETIRGLKLLVAFLIQQPGQLKYIEWPSFPDTLRTASLTLALVAILIVALSSTDAALSFVLALFLRRPA